MRELLSAPTSGATPFQRAFPGSQLKYSPEVPFQSHVVLLEGFVICGFVEEAVAALRREWPNLCALRAETAPKGTFTCCGASAGEGLFYQLVRSGAGGQN